uniref:Uncharacterized protein n=1 Tax=Meloidogyne enterolobii TaxID=390850 RepID=A0A6V7X431_MELEN|nr:unnamed protein product [Meloidogyne enterolobii]
MIIYSDMYINIGQSGISDEKLLLLLTNAAAYMCKAARALNVFYPNLTHVTCVCHALTKYKWKNKILRKPLSD